MMRGKSAGTGIRPPALPNTDHAKDGDNTDLAEEKNLTEAAVLFTHVHVRMSRLLQRIEIVDKNLRHNTSRNGVETHGNEHSRFITVCFALPYREGQSVLASRVQWGISCLLLHVR